MGFVPNRNPKRICQPEHWACHPQRPCHPERGLVIPTEARDPGSRLHHDGHRSGAPSDH